MARERQSGRDPARVADPKGHYDLFIEDGGGPNAVWWVGEVLEAPRALFGFLPDALRVLRKALSGRPERELGGDLSDLLGDTSLAARALPLLGMGRDLPLGRLELREADGSLDLAWEPGDRRAYYRRANAVSKLFAAGLNARLGDLSFALNRYVTVHPLGGCPMGTSAETGVVDAFGRVFGHERLYVVDGAVMPGPIGANPSLTIAAFADRAADALLKEPP